MSGVRASQRWTRDRPCDICGGYPSLRQGRGQRCFGYLSDDGDYAICTREEHAGRLDVNTKTNGYHHRLIGDCFCGVRHDQRPPSVPSPPRQRERSRVVKATRYTITDPLTGAPVAVHVREDRVTSDGELTKSMWWELPDGTKGLAGRASTSLPLYAGERLEGATWCVITEGEKATDALLALDIPAVGTVTGAASIPDDDVLRPLAGLRVALWPDNDDAGREHMQRIGAQLSALGCQTIRVVAWDGAPDKGDAADYVAAGHDADDVVALLTVATAWESPQADDGDDADTMAEPGAGGANTVMLSEVEPEELTWLWPAYIPLGKLTIIDGDPGLGKSMLTLDLGARVTTGDAMPDGSRGVVTGPASVVLLTVEDGLADTIRPRLDAAGADPARVVAITGMPTGNDDERPLEIPSDIPSIRAVVERLGARLVILDPLMAFFGEKVNSWRDQDIRRALTPFAKMAEDTGAAIVVVRHLSKSGGNHALYRGGGSIGIAGAARSVLLVAADPEDDTETTRVLASTKANLSARPAAMAYRIDAPEGEAPRVVWMGTIDRYANELLDRSDEAQEKRHALDEAREFLRLELTAEPQPATAIIRRAKDLGIAERTLRRAKDAEGVIVAKVGFADGAHWAWSLPKMAKNDRRRPMYILDTFDEVGHLRGDATANSHRADPRDGDRCRLCHGSNWWYRGNGERVCGQCHPNPAAIGATP